MLRPNTIAAQEATPLPLTFPFRAPRSSPVGHATRTAPAATADSAASTVPGKRSPASTAIAAAIPPSVEMIGATTPTFCDLTAMYSSTSPAAWPSPAIASHPACGAVGTGRCAAAIPAVRTNPMRATQARTGAGPISRLARVAHSVDMANETAAASPQAIAIIGYYLFAPCNWSGRFPGAAAAGHMIPAGSARVGVLHGQAHLPDAVGWRICLTGEDPARPSRRGHGQAVACDVGEAACCYFRAPPRTKPPRKKRPIARYRTTTGIE